MKAVYKALRVTVLSILLTSVCPVLAGPSPEDLARITEKVQFLMKAASVDSNAINDSEGPFRGDRLEDLLINVALFDIHFEAWLDGLVAHVNRLKTNYNSDLNDSDKVGFLIAFKREIAQRFNRFAHLIKDVSQTYDIFGHQAITEAKFLIDILVKTLKIPNDFQIQGNRYQIANGRKLKNLILEAYFYGDPNAVNLLSNTRHFLTSSIPATIFFRDYDVERIFPLAYYRQANNIATPQYLAKAKATDQQPWDLAAAQVELTDDDLRNGQLRKFPIINVIGFGSKNQFASIEEMKAAAKAFVKKWNERFDGKWIIAYGGDSANPEKPDVGLLVKHIRETYGVQVLAIQSDIVKNQWGGVDKWIDYVHYVPTEKSINAEGKEVVLWGGVKDGRTVGTTKVMFDTESPLHRGFVSQGVVGVGIFGGGEIAKAELAQAEAMEIQIDYFPLQAKNPNAGQLYGEVYSAAKKYAVDKPDALNTVDQCGRLLTGETLTAGQTP